MTTTISRPTTPHPMPIPGPSGGPTSPATKRRVTSGTPPSRGTQTTGRHAPIDAHGTGAAGLDVQDPAAGDQAPSMGVSLLDPALALAADVLDDLERVRIATANRVDILTRDAVDKDGQERGFGLSEGHPDVAVFVAILLTLQKLEHDATLNLQRKMRKHPLGPWMKAQKGVGEKQGARLLAAIGDPYINSAKDAPRTVSALWAYCGLHVLPVGQFTPDDHERHADRDQLPDQVIRDNHACSVGDGGDPGQNSGDEQGQSAGVAAKRRKGERANWSTKAKMRAYLVAESCMKQLSPQCRDGHVIADDHGTGAIPACACSPYRLIYENRRVHTAVTHPDWSDGHSHNDALRVAAKAILRDLWREAKRLHGETEDES